MINRTKTQKEENQRPGHNCHEQCLSPTTCPGYFFKNYETRGRDASPTVGIVPGHVLNKVYFPYELYKAAIDKNFVPELCVFLKLLSIYRHRTIQIDKPQTTISFLANQIGVSSKLVYRSISKFTSIGIITKEKKENRIFWRIKSNKQVNEILGAKKGKVHYWDPRKLNKFDDLKKFILCLPILSNINTQLKYVRYHENLCKKRDSVRYKYSPVFRKKVDHEFSKIKVIQTTPILSVQKMAEIIDASTRTAIKYKNFLVKKKFIVSKNRIEKIGDAGNNHAGNKAKKLDSFTQNVFIGKTGLILRKLASAIIPVYVSI